MSIATSNKTMKGAGAYVVPPTSYRVSRSSILEAAILLEVLFWFFFPNVRSEPAAWLLAGLSVPILGGLFMRRLVYYKFIRSPSPETGELTDQRWTSFSFEGWGGDSLKAKILHTEGKSRGLVLYIHGYGSSLYSGESRCLHLNKQGMTVVGMNLRGHGDCEHRYEWTMLKIVTDIEAMMTRLSTELEVLPEKVWIYGHSMGGFLSLRLGANPTGWWGKRLTGVAVESPATSFPMVIERGIPKYLRFTIPWIRAFLRREYERIHPDLPIRYASAAVPHIGLPKVPILVLQSAEDKRLGLHHHELLAGHLSTHPPPSEIHLIKGHAHTSKQDSATRKQLLENWLVTTENGVID